MSQMSLARARVYKCDFPSFLSTQMGEDLSMCLHVRKRHLRHAALGGCDRHNARLAAQTECFRSAEAPTAARPSRPVARGGLGTMAWRRTVRRRRSHQRAPGAASVAIGPTHPSNKRTHPRNMACPACDCAVVERAARTPTFNPSAVSWRYGGRGIFFPLAYPEPGWHRPPAGWTVLATPPH
jgi:hypothetical protein